MKRIHSAHAHRNGMGHALTAATIAAGCLLTLAGPANAASAGGSSVKPAVQATPANSRAAGSAPAEETTTQWHGESLANLVKRQWRWVVSIPLGVNPITESSGVNCGINQQGPVWFLGGPGNKTYTMTCTVPAGKAILAPVNSYLNDYPCPDPAFEPAPGESLQHYLRVGAASFMDSFTLIEAQLDGKALKPQRVATNLFPFTAAASLSQLDSCITGSPQVGVADGYFVLIEPLPPGDHQLVIRAASPYTGMGEGTINLKIR